MKNNNNNQNDLLILFGCAVALVLSLCFITWISHLHQRAEAQARSEAHRQAVEQVKSEIENMEQEEKEREKYWAIHKIEIAKQEEEKKRQEEEKRKEEEYWKYRNSTYTRPTESLTQKYEGGSSGRLSKSGGVFNYGGRTEMWYSSKVLYHKDTAQWTPDANGVYRDKDGYVVIASSDHKKGTTLETSHGTGKVYDSGCASGVTDIYVNW